MGDFWNDLEQMLRERRRYTEQLEAEVERYRAGIRKFADYQDTHAPGPFVTDANAHALDHLVQICADEECAEYWPCSSAEVIELLDPEAFWATPILQADDG